MANLKVSKQVTEQVLTFSAEREQFEAQIAPHLAAFQARAEAALLRACIESGITNPDDYILSIEKDGVYLVSKNKPLAVVPPAPKRSKRDTPAEVKE